jgi:hypothetical protein
MALQSTFSLSAILTPVDLLLQVLKEATIQTIPGVIDCMLSELLLRLSAVVALVLVVD